jgi:1,4-dihydroxy-2-naphthoate octaprenyltransferase
MAASLLCIDMATTTANNYKDYRSANRREGYGYERHNAIVRDGLSQTSVLTVIAVLLTLAAVFGALLTLRTNLLVLLLGMLSFAVGLLYSTGPAPISRTPFGELLSGSFMGFVIPFLAAYVHVYDRGLAEVEYAGGALTIRFSVLEVLWIFLVSLPAVVGIANIMLANNICDMEDDLENKRYTLPLYIGKKRALTLFLVLYILSFADIAVLIAFGILPIISAGVLLLWIPVQKSCKAFFALQTKKDTFVLAVKNFAMINTLLTATVAAGADVNYLR